MATTTTSTTSRNQGASTAMPQQVFMVGNNNAFAEIKHKLTNSSKEREVISITGMGGIGKTTLAKNVYEDKDIKRHFDIQAWITVSQSYSLDELLQVLLQSIEASSLAKGQSAGTFELKDKVRKLLLGKRYLIAIDDIWSTQVWDDLEICFPSEKRNGSRVLLTTRLTNVATHVSSGGLPFSMPTLSKEESWDLFCKKVFAKESCPPSIEFEEIGRDIVMKCKGLPLSIMVSAGILSKADMKVEDWENVARDVAFASTLYEEQNCEKILLLSYNHLPGNLKTCFLYLGVFPEDYEIPVKKLVGYWVAQGFVEDEALVANNKEEVAWQKLQDLIDRNLILVEKRGWSGRINTCKIHEMCLRLAKGKNILHVIDDKFQVGQSSKEISQEEEENGNFWVSLQSIFKISRLGFDHRTLQKCYSFLAIFPSKYMWYKGSPILIDYLLTAASIQVLDLLPLCFPYFPSLWINNLSQLRYLALYIVAFRASLPILSSLKKLQTLILRSEKPFVVYLTLPKTAQLRELSIYEGSTFHFRNQEENLKLENLTTLSFLSDLCCNNEALVRYEEPELKDNMHPIDLLHTLSRLEQLEDIRFDGYDWLKYSGLVYIPKPYDFPPKIKKLKFCNAWMKLELTMTILGRLPNLDVLHLKWHAFDNSETEWEQVEEGFPKLKVLVFEFQRFCRWKDSDFTFPSLECLVLKDCVRLESLPYECLSGCPCLKLIHLEGLCTDGVLKFAKKIQNDGDGLLKVREEKIKIIGGIS